MSILLIVLLVLFFPIVREFLGLCFLIIVGIFEGICKFIFGF